MKENKKSYFYVLETADGTYYGGYTTEPKRRLKEHNSGTGAKYTQPAKRRPVQMIHLEEFEDKRAAMRAEYAFKHLSSRRKKEDYLKNHSEQSLCSKLLKEDGGA